MFITFSEYKENSSPFLDISVLDAALPFLTTACSPCWDVCIRCKRGVHLELEKLVNFHRDWISADDWDDGDLLRRWPGAPVVGIVDCTEVHINAWHADSFSVKKAHHTIKYQVIINVSTMKVMNIYGPFRGSVHDSVVYKKSDFALWLFDNDLRILGDKAYTGCSGVISPVKKNNFRYTPTQRRRFNFGVAQKRIFIENHFAQLKVWRILTHCYRGSLVKHSTIFWACEILECIRKFQ